MQELIRNIPDHKIAGVYALVDENGKAYIGSSVNIQLRMQTHLNNMRSILRNRESGLISQKLGKAVLEGHTFECVVLEELPDPDTIDLHFVEQQYISLFGGVKNTYNHGYALTEIIPLHLLKILERFPEFRKTGVFAITNTLSNRTFLSRGVNMRSVLLKNYKLLIQKEHSNADLQRDFDAGCPLKIDILTLCSIDDLVKEYWKFAYLIGRNHLYNNNITDNVLIRGEQYLEKQL